MTDMELRRLVRECAARYDTVVAHAARRALRIGAAPRGAPKRKRRRKRKVKGISYCFRNEQSPMDW